ncbi:peptidoglycan-binding domain-containing protein [Roseinatronobacter sp. NSM]|uniref:peptidoglycan-binding domain-containing protein n=1 Tax=Roseinatronobacter sp. NSM TaxID=3457785 RepID=UPI0040362B5E
MTQPRNKIRSALCPRLAGLKAGLLAGCILALATPVLANPVETSRARIDPSQLDLPQASSRMCWARYATRNAQNNGVIVETAFRVPCPEQMTTEFIATLQRALHARGQYDGPITGQADSQTRAAVQRFQKSNGFDSPILTLETAQNFGLLPIELGRN